MLQACSFLIVSHKMMEGTTTIARISSHVFPFVFHSHADAQCVQCEHEHSQIKCTVRTLTGYPCVYELQ